MTYTLVVKDVLLADNSLTSEFSQETISSVRIGEFLKHNDDYYKVLSKVHYENNGDHLVSVYVEKMDKFDFEETLLTK